MYATPLIYHRPLILPICSHDWHEPSSTRNQHQISWKAARAFRLTVLITIHNPHPNTSLPAETKSVSCTALPIPMEER